MNKLIPPPLESGRNFFSGRFFTFPSLLSAPYLLDLFVSGVISVLFFLLTKNYYLLILAEVILSVAVVIRFARREKLEFIPKPNIARMEASRHFFNVMYTSFFIALASLSILELFFDGVPRDLFSSPNSSPTFNFLVLPVVFSGIVSFVISIPQGFKFWNYIIYGPHEEKEKLFYKMYDKPHKKYFENYKLEKRIDGFFYRLFSYAYNINLGTLIVFFLFFASFPALVIWVYPSSMIFLPILLLLIITPLYFLFYKKILFADRDEVVKMLWIGKSLKEKDWGKMTAKEFRKGYAIGLFLIIPLSFLMPLPAIIFVIFGNIFMIHIAIQKLLISLKLVKKS